MRSRVLQALAAGLAAVSLANGSPLESSEGDSTGELIPYGTPIPVFADMFEDQNVLKDSLSLPLDEGSVALSCIDCVARAGIVVNMTLEEGKNTTDAIFSVAFYHTEAHIELGLLAQGHGKAFFPIWTPGPPPDGDVFLDLRVEVGIALEIEADIDVRTGFTIAVPDGSFFTYIPSSGFQETNLAEWNGLFEPIPLHVESGSATFKAALQARVVLSGNLDTAVVDAAGEVGVYVNLPELAVDVYSTDTCGLEAASFVGISLGLWAEGDASVGWKDDDVAQVDGQRTFAATPLTLEGTATDCLIDNPTSIRIGGAPPITSDAPITPTTFKVSGAPPITRSEIVTTAEVDGDSSLISASGAFATEFPEDPTSASSRSSFTFFGNSTVTAPPSGYTTSTVYTTKVYTVITCAADVTSCPARSSQTVVVTDVVELYTTICPVTDIATVPTDVSSTRVKIAVHNEETTHPPSAGTRGTHVPHKNDTLIRHISQPSVPGETTSTYLGDGRSNVTKHSKVVTLTRGPYQDADTPSVVPVTAGALGYKDIYGFGGFLAIAVCLLVL
ncbi:hypothetical protein FOMG_19284 [Fusarium oxysporum f. sp. melonis 26406]|uniref:Uncharacterized protein n=1 Tax=Fusarium oxysporum f. sp. melonis 26406 TaxID=1089452 RepID=W9YXS8_FUSOX|nr:hypothetical protein FOMG_19284 [Fusarium oxysporum f. sp. melonis 26406]